MAKILIASKLAHSIWLEIIVANEHGRMPTPVELDAPRVELKGTNSLRVAVDSPSQDGFRFATTEVDEALWEAWKEKNKGLEFMRKGMVFEAKNQSEFQAKAKERVNDVRTRTGMEPLAQEGDPRLAAAPGAPVHQRVDADTEHLAKLSGHAAAA